MISPGQRIAKLALGTIDSVRCQMLLNTLCLQLWIVFALPFQVGITAGALMLSLPGFAAQSTSDRATIGAY